MADATLVQRLATFAAAQTPVSVPPEVIASVRRRVLDILGIAAAAAAPHLRGGGAPAIAEGAASGVTRLAPRRGGRAAPGGDGRFIPLADTRRFR